MDRWAGQNWFPAVINYFHSDVECHKKGTICYHIHKDINHILCQFHTLKCIFFSCQAIRIVYSFLSISEYRFNRHSLFHICFWLEINVPFLVSLEFTFCFRRYYTEVGHKNLIKIYDGLTQHSWQDGNEENETVQGIQMTVWNKEKAYFHTYRHEVQWQLILCTVINSSFGTLCKLARWTLMTYAGEVEKRWGTLFSYICEKLKVCGKRLNLVLGIQLR